MYTIVHQVRNWQIQMALSQHPVLITIKDPPKQPDMTDGATELLVGNCSADQVLEGLWPMFGNIQNREMEATNLSYMLLGEMSSVWKMGVCPGEWQWSSHYSLITHDQRNTRGLPRDCENKELCSVVALEEKGRKCLACQEMPPKARFHPGMSREAMESPPYGSDRPRVRKHFIHYCWCLLKVDRGAHHFIHFSDCDNWETSFKICHSLSPSSS